MNIPKLTKCCLLKSISDTKGDGTTSISSSIEIIELDGESAAKTMAIKKGQWNCPLCTYILNEKLNNRCVMCEIENPFCHKATRRSSRTGAPR